MTERQVWKVRFSDKSGPIIWNVVARSAVHAIELVEMERPWVTIHAVETGKKVYIQ